MTGVSPEDERNIYHVAQHGRSYFCGAPVTGGKSKGKWQPKTTWGILLMDHKDGCTHVDLWRKLCHRCDRVMGTGPYR